MNGAIWVANGKEHIETAIRSSNSYKLLNPGLKTALFTDSEVTYPEFDFQFAIPDTAAKWRPSLLDIWLRCRNGTRRKDCDCGH